MFGSMCSFESLDDIYPTDAYEKLKQHQKEQVRRVSIEKLESLAKICPERNISPRTIEKTGVIDIERNTTCNKNHVQTLNNLKRWTHFQNSSCFKQTSQPSPRTRNIYQVDRH